MSIRYVLVEFIGATNADRKLRAFDKATGALAWETVMGGPGRATPSTYEAGGRQPRPRRPPKPD